jgi:hypothetical protein
MAAVVRPAGDWRLALKLPAVGHCAVETVGRGARWLHALVALTPFSGRLWIVTVGPFVLACRARPGAPSLASGSADGHQTVTFLAPPFLVCLMPSP